LIVADIDSSPGTYFVSEFQPMGGNGETAWVARGTVMHAARSGENTDLYTAELLGQVEPLSVTTAWPIAVVRLARALLQGQDCRMPLSDAIEEAGHSELAEHFRKESQHPCTCFGLEMILRGDS
jgi:hypothetical protein